MTLADELRAAAQKIRETAGAASPGPWQAKPVIYGNPEDGWGPPSHYEVYGPGQVSNQDRCVVSHMHHEGGGADETDAAHIALWGPDKAVLVAGILEMFTRTFDSFEWQNAREGIRTRVLLNELDLKVLDLARAINGSQP